MRDGAIELRDAGHVDAVAEAARGIGMHAIDRVLAEVEIAVDGERAHRRAIVTRRNHRGGIQRRAAHLPDTRQHHFAADIDRSVQLAVDLQCAVGDEDGAGEVAAVGVQDHRADAGLDEALRALQRVVDDLDELACRIRAVADDDHGRVAAGTGQRDGRALQAIPVSGELQARHTHGAGAAIDGHRARRAGEDRIAAIGQRAGGVGGAVPVRARRAPRAVAAARAAGGRHAVAIPQIGRARAQD
ncbi:hypothetical protein D3C86_1270440 [compost metagenome]